MQQPTSCERPKGNMVGCCFCSDLQAQAAAIEKPTELHLPRDQVDAPISEVQQGVRVRKNETVDCC